MLAVGEQTAKLLRFASMTVRSCKVSCRDGQGIEHSVDVSAETLFEAVAQGWRLLADDDWNNDTSRRPPFLTVRVKQPELEHKVRLQDFENWLNSPPKSPAEMALKNRLRKVLNRHD
jgi:hypothetical protein